MDLNAVKEFIEQNKDNDEVKAYLQGFKQLSVEEVQKFITENTDAKKWFDSEKDKHFSKGLETWKTNNLQKLIDEAVRKANPEETPEQKQLRELQEKINKMEAEKTYEALKNKALTVATEKKIPVSIVDLFIGEDEESTLSNLVKFEEAMKPYIQEVVEERLKSGAYVPPKDKANGGALTKEMLKTMKPEEINARWAEVQELLKQ